MDFANEVKQSFMTFRKAYDSPFIILSFPNPLNFIYTNLAINYEHTSVEN